MITGFRTILGDKFIKGIKKYLNEHITNYHTGGESSQILTTKLSLTKEDIWEANTIPVDIVDTPGEGKAIELISGSLKLTFETISFIGTIGFVLDTLTESQTRQINMIGNTISTFINFTADASNDIDISASIIENKKLQVKLNQDSNNPFEEELLQAGNEIDVTYTGSFLQLDQGIVKNSITIVDDGGSETFTDDGEGILTGTQGGTGTIDYTTGAYSITFSEPPGVVGILGTYKTGIGDSSLDIYIAYRIITL